MDALVTRGVLDASKAKLNNHLLYQDTLDSMLLDPGLVDLAGPKL